MSSGHYPNQYFQEIFKMQLANYEPWNVFHKVGRLHEALYRPRELSANGVGRWALAVDIHEEDGSYVIEADVPGVDAKDIEITSDAGQLTIKGTRGDESVTENGSFKRVERVRGSFYRRFSLPDLADVEQIGASSRDGVLTITIKKQEKAQSRRIPVS